jgi:hypothetical protein
MGFHIFFTFTLLALKSTGGRTFSRGRKRLKREGNERYWGKKWKWEAKTKNIFL